MAARTVAKCISCDYSPQFVLFSGDTVGKLGQAYRNVRQGSVQQRLVSKTLADYRECYAMVDQLRAGNRRAAAVCSRVRSRRQLAASQHSVASAALETIRSSS